MIGTTNAKNCLFKQGSATLSTSGSIEINCGFRPTMVICTTVLSSISDKMALCEYNILHCDDIVKRCVNGGKVQDKVLPNNDADCINSITDTGFIFGKVASNRNKLFWIATKDETIYNYLSSNYIVLSNGELGHGISYTLKNFKAEFESDCLKLQTVNKNNTGTITFYPNINTFKNKNCYLKITFKSNGDIKLYDDIYDGLRLKNKNKEKITYYYPMDLYISNSAIFYSPKNSNIKVIAVNNNPIYLYDIEIVKEEDITF